jgi:hypothetical protein
MRVLTTFYNVSSKCRRVGMTSRLGLPLLLQKQDIEQHCGEYVRLKAYDDRVAHLMNDLKLEGDGWVSNERYKEAREKCDELQRNWSIDRQVFFLSRTAPPLGSFRRPVSYPATVPG